jgi:hypothetical protein
MKKRGTYKVLQGYLKLKKKNSFINYILQRAGPGSKEKKGGVSNTLSFPLLSSPSQTTV